MAGLGLRPAGHGAERGSGGRPRCLSPQVWSVSLSLSFSPVVFERGLVSRIPRAAMAAAWVCLLCGCSCYLGGLGTVGRISRV